MSGSPRVKWGINEANELELRSINGSQRKKEEEGKGRKRENILKWKKKYKQRKETMKKGFLKIQQELRVKYTEI